MYSRLVLACLLAFGLVPHATRAAEPETPNSAFNARIDYARDVEPIFRKLCLRCHGPEEQESGLRVDRRGSLLRGGDLGQPAIVVGQSDASFLIRVVSGKENDLVMPPEGDALTAEQVALLKLWIDQGMQMPTSEVDSDRLTTDHWSFQPIQRPALPAAEEAWAAHPIDLFILRSLREQGLRPSPRAEPNQLIRRVSLDVLGLLPTSDEVAEFTSDRSPDAYQRLVDRVLASPRYGERWARHWLDVVRFADTNGFETNTPRPNAYHYRDWVIRSLNDDKPYDQFVFEQLAGDVVGEYAATGFLVGGPFDTVKSPDPNLTLMQRQDELADMVNTTGATFLALTVGCARCHNHKFDPITQRDYYAMQAVFAGVEHGERPLRDDSAAERTSRLAQVRESIRAVERALASLGVSLRPAVNARENEERFEPRVAKFVRFTIDATNQYEPCLDELEIYSAAGPELPATNVALASAGARAISSGDYQGNPKHKLEHIHDGRYGNSFSWISNQVGGGWVQIELATPTRIDRIVWQRDRDEQYKDRLAIEYVIEAAERLGDWHVIASSKDRLPANGSIDEAIERQLASLPTEVRERSVPLIQQWRRLRSQSSELERPTPVAYAGQFKQPDSTFRLYRGDPMQPREEVVPDALEVIGSLGLPRDAMESQRRVALARWITDARNPLAARVIANRVWQHHFGVGLVATPSDFGGNGARPTHPELLDWLAAELIDSGWSLKHLHRLILTSSTYQQSSKPRSDALQIDADSRLLWRFPPRRLDAESIRDNVLATSGVLDMQMYGPGYSVFEDNSNYVRVYQPKEQWGPDEWRRMVYRYNVRMEQEPVFGSFDCPDAGQPAPKRGISTTAIQSLNLLNSGFMLQQAELFAERIYREAGSSTKEQVVRLFQLALGREPDAGELSAARQIAESHGLAAVCRAVFNSNEFLFVP